ncbi:MAG: response regulator [Planctomycetes bacterium]|nr:response regulator [Planctomycetota bacterium]
MKDPKAPLKTVDVPPALGPIFLRAQEYVARYFSDRVENPEHSLISISGERYILVRAASMSIEFHDLVLSLYRDHDPDEARSVANNLLFDLAHAIGKADAKAFGARMGVTDPIERLSAGPVHFSFSGWAFVRILPESAPTADENFFLLYEHPFSFESDAWVRRGRRSDHPVCIVNAGYSSGWCEESFGVPLVAAEVECLAKGDSRCRFVMAPPGRIEGRLAEYFRGDPAGAARPWMRSPAAGVTVPEFFQRKRMEEDLRRSHAELELRVRERTEELAGANAALREEIAERERGEAERWRLEARMLEAQKLESLGVLAGGIAHDFNNLLVGVLGNVGIALKSLGPESPAYESLEQIGLAATRAADLTRQILAYSGRGRFRLERVDATGLVEEMARLLSTVVSKKASVRLELSRDLPAIEADATQFRQVVMNLITNASDALRDAPGEIVVRTGVAKPDRDGLSHSFLEEGAVAGPCVYVEVEDTGCGMDEATRARMFEPFYTTRFAGRGLGLSAALGIVRAHRGGIAVSSAPGQGTTVRVLFPAAGTAAATPSAVPAASPPPPAVRRTGAVLIVEDDDGGRLVVARILSDAGYPVLLARDGLEAIRVYRERKAEIGLVLLDVTMPRLGGAETLEELRRIDPAVRVILMSGYDEEDVAGRFASAPPLGFLRKPYPIEEMLGRVGDVLEPERKGNGGG